MLVRPPENRGESPARLNQLFTSIADETQMHLFDADVSNHDESPATRQVHRRQHRRMHLRLACYWGEATTRDDTGRESAEELRAIGGEGVIRAA